MRLIHTSMIFASAVLTLTLAACTASPVVTTPPGRVTQEGIVPPSDITAQAMLREDSQGAVTVSVKPLNLDTPGDTLKFDIVMSTHSVELDMDLAALSVLETDTGLSVAPTTWDAPRGGHHVEGTLSFPATADGKTLLDGVKELTLTIRDVDAPERTFVWELLQ